MAQQYKLYFRRTKCAAQSFQSMIRIMKYYIGSRLQPVRFLQATDEYCLQRADFYRPQTKLRQGNVLCTCLCFCSQQVGGGGLCPREVSVRTVTCGQYASNWNAFL